MKKPNYIEYRQHLETIALIMEELRSSAPQAIARALIQRGIPNAQGEVKWSVRRVETILKRLAPLTHPKQRSNRLVSYESAAALRETRRKWRLFHEHVLAGDLLETALAACGWSIDHEPRP